MSQEPLSAGIRWSVDTFADASALLQDIRHGVINGTDGILGTLALANRLLMSAEAVAEVDEHIADVAVNSDQEQAMRNLWTGYKTRITVVDGGVVDLDVPAVAALAERDPDDLHLVVAAGQYTSAVILSEDLDLRDLGLAPPSWLTGARDVMTISYGDLTVHVAGTGVAAAASAVAGTLRAARDGSAPAMIAVAAAVGVIVYIAVDPGRRQIVLHRTLGVLQRMAEIERDRQAAFESLSAYIGVAARAGLCRPMLAGLDRD